MRVLIFSCLFCSFLYAESYEQMISTGWSIHSDVDQSYCEEELYGNPAPFADRCSIRTSLYGEWFFASVREDGLTYAIRSEDGNPLHGKFLEISQRWRPGFRIGLGSHLTHDAWEINMDWTSFQSDIVQTAHAPIAPSGATYLTPLFIDASSYAQLIGNSLQEAKEHWTLSFNALSFVLSRLYDLSAELGIRPRVGLFAAWIDQDVAISYRTYGSPGGSTVVSSNTSIENNTWRVGPFLGAKFDWHVRRKLWLFGMLQGAALYRNLHFQQVETSVGNSEGDFRLSLSDHPHRLQPWVNTQLGIAWGSFIRSCRQFIEIAIQYECQYYWHEFESRMLYEQIPGVQDRNINNLGDLSLQSVALRLQVDF